MELVGTLASIAGLIFSILAFLFSKRASKAAEEARDSVLLKSLSQDMSGASRTAAEIVRYVSMDRGDMALLRVGELLNDVSYWMSRWDGRLSEQSKGNLLVAKEQLVSIHDVLTRKPAAELSPPAEGTARPVVSARQCYIQRGARERGADVRQDWLIMEDAKAFQLFEQILLKTKQARLRWEPTANDSEYFSVLPGGFVVSIHSWYEPYVENSDQIALSLKTGDQELLRVTPDVDGVGLEGLRELHELARRRALGVDAQVDRLLGELAKL